MNTMTMRSNAKTMNLLQRAGALATGCVVYATALGVPVDMPVQFSGSRDGQSKTWSFPYIVDTDNVRAAEKINEYLFLGELELAPPASPSMTALPAAGLVLLQEELESNGVRTLNDGRVVEVGFFRRPAHMPYGRHYKLQFDARLGTVIWANDMLTSTGMKALAERMVKARASHLDNEQRRLEAIVKRGDAAMKKEGVHRDTVEQLVAAYEKWQADCLDNRASSEHLTAGLVQLVDGGVLVKSFSCNGEELDNLAPFEKKLSPKEAAPYLSAYGKYLLTGQGHSQPPFDNALGKVLHGAINKSLPVTMYLSRSASNGFFSGHYYYDRHRMPINLDGRIREKGIYEIKEGDDRSSARPQFRLQLRDGRLVGKWQSGQKQFDIELKP